MNRRETVLALLALGIAPIAARAQPAAKLRRVGILLQGTEAEEARQVAEFLRGLRDLGYEEGRNVTFEPRFPAQQPQLFDQFAAELVRLNVDVLVAVSPPAVLAAQRVATRIPVVFGFVADPVGLKLVTSLGRPGGNLTGLSTQSDEIIAKRVQLLKEAVPKLAQVLVLFYPSDRGAYEHVEAMQAAAQRLKVAVRAVEIRGPEELEKAFATFGRERNTGVVTVPGGLLFNQRSRIAALALEHKLPSMFPTSLAVEAGALMAYGPNVFAMCYRLAYFVDRILKGANPRDLPVEQPTKIDLDINLKTAKALGLTIPHSLLISANKVIE